MQNKGFYALFAQQQQNNHFKKKQQKNKLKKQRKQKKKRDRRCHIRKIADSTWHTIFGFLRLKDNVQIEHTCKLFRDIIDAFGIVTNEVFEITTALPDEDPTTLKLIQSYISWYMTRSESLGKNINDHGPSTLCQKIPKFKFRHINNLVVHFNNRRMYMSSRNLRANFYNFLAYVSKVDDLTIKLKDVDCDFSNPNDENNPDLSDYNQYLTNLANITQIRSLSINMGMYPLSQSINENNPNCKLVPSQLFENVQQNLRLVKVNVDTTLIHVLNSLNVSEFELGSMDWSQIDQEYLKNKLDITNWTNLRKISVSYNYPSPNETIATNVDQQYYLNRKLMSQPNLNCVSLSFYKVDKLLPSMIPTKIESKCIQRVNVDLQGSHCNIIGSLLKLFTTNNRLKIFSINLQDEIRNPQVLHNDEMKMFEMLLTNTNIDHFNIQSQFNLTSLANFIDYFCLLLYQTPQLMHQLNTMCPDESYISMELNRNELDQFISFLAQLISPTNIKHKFIKRIGINRIYLMLNIYWDWESSDIKPLAKRLNKFIKSEKIKLKHPKKCKIHCVYDEEFNEIYIAC